jgi:hypothetical protein
MVLLQLHGWQAPDQDSMIQQATCHQGYSNDNEDASMPDRLAR